MMKKILYGDCLEVMKKMEDNYVETIITDPPYGLSFMGKKWDYDVPSIEIWQECLRVLKPGGTALIFAGSRTQHRMAVSVEDAGFILKDCLMWLYGSGFPKATDISKQIDKNNGKSKVNLKPFGDYIKDQRELKGYTQSQLDEVMETCTAVSWWEGRKTGVQLPSKKTYEKLKGVLNLDNRFDDLINWEEARREIIGKKIKARSEGQKSALPTMGAKTEYIEIDITTPATSEAQQWNGWKSHGLKPAYEPVLVAVKPNDGTYANNALKWGVSGLNIDGGRIEYEKGGDLASNPSLRKSVKGGNGGKIIATETESRFMIPSEKGRFPTNIILDGSEEVKAIFPNTKSGKPGVIRKGINNGAAYGAESRSPGTPMTGFGDSGSASRFFYCAKTSKKERGEGNNHPTVKPLKLIEYLCTLTKTPTGGIVLDPFAGSGTTGLAAINTGRPFILIEKDTDYYEIMKKRLDAVDDINELEEIYNKLDGKNNV